MECELHISLLCRRPVPLEYCRFPRRHTQLMGAKQIAVGSGDDREVGDRTGTLVLNDDGDIDLLSDLRDRG